MGLGLIDRHLYNREFSGNIVAAVDKTQHTVCVFIDSCEAFDNSLLLHKLEHYVLRGVNYLIIGSNT